MIRPGPKDLGDHTVAAAGTIVGDWVSGLEGVRSVSWQLRFAYGSGGSTIKAYLQTSLDQGTTAIDIACIAMTTANLRKGFNISADITTALLTFGDGVLSDDTYVDGILGDRFRTKLISTGTYGGSSLVSSRIVAR
jgi:hypothetical protein